MPIAEYSYSTTREPDACDTSTIMIIIVIVEYKGKSVCVARPQHSASAQEGQLARHRVGLIVVTVLSNTSAVEADSTVEWYNISGGGNNRSNN